MITPDDLSPEAMAADNLKLLDEIERLKQRETAAYDAGWAEAIRLYAVWRDGQQLVGVMERPLQEVLDKGPDTEVRDMHLRNLPKTTTTSSTDSSETAAG